MKKILIASVLVALGGSAFAASNTAGFPLAAGVATTVASGNGNCELLSADVKTTMSTGNLGHVSCDDSTANVGVAVGNTSGKGITYSIGSTGGGVTASTAGTIPTAAILKTAAEAKAAASS